MIVPAHSQVAAQDLGILSRFKAEKHGGEKGSAGFSLSSLIRKAVLNAKRPVNDYLFWLFQALERKEAKQGKGAARE